MKREKVFAASIISAVSCFLVLAISFYWGFMGFEMLQGGEMLYGISCMATLVLAILTFILDTVAAVKTREAKAGYNKKGLAITTIVFEILLIVASIMGPVVLGSAMGAFQGLTGIIAFGCTMTLPILLADIAWFISIIIKIVGLCGKKSVSVNVEK